MKQLIISLIIGLIIGFFIGRSTIKKGETKYIKGDTITDTLYIPEPFKVEVPKYITLPTKKDTLWLDSIKYITEKVDTSAIIQDYVLERTYAFNVFDNESGTFDAVAKVGYNKLLGFNYNYTPIQKQTIITKKELLTPFISGSYHTYKAVGVGGGVFINNLGVEYLYNVSLEDIPDYHTFGIKIKF